MKEYTFLEIINNKNIRIPKIQRDYAQGRKIPKVNEIRKNFVHSLIKTIKGEIPKQELDFVYGNERQSAFEPLDGQQRLTTLFLLHWLLGVDLKDDKRKSRFTYETRTTSTDFCGELVKHTPESFIKKAKLLQQNYENEELNEKIKEEKINNVFTEVIVKHDWFQWQWNFDPTIQSMLVMLDSLYKEIGFYNEDINDKTLETYRNNLIHITFNFLDLNDFKMSDELFIKMNDRGKQLSDFDIVKSTLEEEIQIQKKKKLLSEATEENWRSLMDGKWIDFFWQKYAAPVLEKKEIDENEKLKAVENAEVQFKKLLLRLVALQVVHNAPEDLSTCTKSELTLINKCYNSDDSNLDNILNSYNDYWLEKDCKELYRINFDLLIQTVNNILYEYSEKKFKEITSLIPTTYRFSNAEDGKDFSYIDSFLDEKVPNDFISCFYCLIKYINTYPLITDFKFIASENEKTNLNDWMRIMRNIIKNDNNNVRIDKLNKLVNALKGIDLIFKDFVEYRLKSPDASVIVFFGNLNKVYKGLDNSSLKEEVEKAKLSISEAGGNWISELSKAEQNYFLWGQIRCLLNWSANNIETFSTYSSKLTELLDAVKDDKENVVKYFAAIITENDYWKERNRMFIFVTSDRDYSLKRYLRDEEYLTKTGFYGNALKALLDKWLLPDYNEKSAIEYLDTIIKERLNTETGWKKCILEDNSILNYSYWKTIFMTPENHILLGRNKTQDSHCLDPCLAFINDKLVERNIKAKLNDSQAEPPNSIIFPINNTNYEIKWGKKPGSFEILENKISRIYSSDEEMLNYISGIIEQITITDKE